MSAIQARRVNGRVLVYVDGVPDLEFTRLHDAIADHGSRTVATECIRHLHDVRRHLNPPLGLWDSPVEALEQAVTDMMVARYRVRATRGRGSVSLECGTTVSGATVKTVLARLRKAFDTAIKLSLLTDTPMDGLRTSWRPPRRSGGRVTGFTAGHGPLKRWPDGYYRVKGKVVVRKGVLDNDELPGLLRAAGRRAGWTARDHAVLELMLCSGARVTEVVEMTWAGIGSAGLDEDLLLHNKGRGREPWKPLTLSEDAKNVLQEYFRNERARQDPRHPRFEAWSRGRAWTPRLYLKFLAAEGIDPAHVPVFLTCRGTPYTAATFRGHAWSKARETDGKADPVLGGRVVASAHHIRHWFVCRRLGEIQREHGADLISFVEAVQVFVDRMGWKSWESMSNYDGRGVATALLKRVSQKMAAAVATVHGIDQSLVALAIRGGFALAEGEQA